MCFATTKNSSSSSSRNRRRTGKPSQAKARTATHTHTFTTKLSHCSCTLLLAPKACVPVHEFLPACRYSPTRRPVFFPFPSIAGQFQLASSSSSLPLSHSLKRRTSRMLPVCLSCFPIRKRLLLLSSVLQFSSVLRFSAWRQISSLSLKRLAENSFPPSFHFHSLAPLFSSLSLAAKKIGLRVSGGSSD